MIVQAENDTGDMAEMRDGVFVGLGLTTGQQADAGDMIHCFQENERSGAEFFARTVEPLLRLHRPDLLWIDPALAYIGGESNSQKDVEQFLRGWLNPLLHRYECAAIGVRVGQGCQRIMDDKFRNLDCSLIEVDEVWGFIGMKQKTANYHLADPDMGDVWTWIALDAKSKLVPTFAVGERSAEMADAFMADLATRLSPPGSGFLRRACGLRWGD